MTNDPRIAAAQAELGLFDDDQAAAIVEVKPKTFKEYCKRGVGPRYAVVKRKRKHTLPWLQQWLAAGGTRNFEND